MIVEFFKYLTTPATPIAKKLGQLQEAIAMQARYKRHKTQWEPHLVNSRESVKFSANGIPPEKDIIILGSGLLLDIPINFLSGNFNHVYLVDVVHLRKIRSLCKNKSNVSLVEHDVTGFSQSLLSKNTKNKSLNMQASIPCLTENTGLIISANMLSQIHLAPVYYAEKALNYNDEQIAHLATKIMQDHIDLLNSARPQCCLIADHKRLYKDKLQNIVDIEMVFSDADFPEPDRTWYWEIAPKGELERNVSMTSEVFAYYNFSK